MFLFVSFMRDLHLLLSRIRIVRVLEDGTVKTWGLREGERPGREALGEIGAAEASSGRSIEGSG